MKIQTQINGVNGINGKHVERVKNRLVITKIIDFSEVADEAVLGRLSKRRADKLRTLRNAKVRNQSLTAELLLQKCIKDTLAAQVPFEKERQFPVEISEEPDGKPYLADYPWLHFSLSHSGEYVLLALSASRVGADIQQFRPVRPDIAARFFVEGERDFIKNSPDREAAFFIVWTLKEAYIKYTGKGLAQGLESFCVICRQRQHDACKSSICIQQALTANMPSDAYSCLAVEGMFAAGAVRGREVFQRKKINNVSLCGFIGKNYAIGVCGDDFSDCDIQMVPSEELWP